ncbi:hypothetical protein TPA0907_55860 [Micromonospora humidisoli]|uniref:hypothetical protein n=1 Tax=Micromonospora sp. AKA109 TaxID=2733865 RepID=UPI0022C3ED8E|nr:hypothetical protein [Micromonospora sp. AKA109]GHJ11219.1 hypothetical protein TPA0907_55860 [Micromonospora sp. AKA109]
MSSIKDRIRRAKASPGGTATRPVRLWLAPDMGLVDRYQRAVADLEEAESAETPAPADSLEGGSAVVELRERVDQLRAQLDEHSLELTVRALDDDEWQRLVDEHPPRRATDTTEADPRDAKYGWNASTFPRALLRAATVAPVLDDEDWQMLLGSPGQRGVLTHPQVEDAAGAVAGLTRFRLDIPFS